MVVVAARSVTVVALDDLVHTIERHANACRQLRLREIHWLENLLEQHLTGMCRCSIGGDADHPERSC